MRQREGGEGVASEDHEKIRTMAVRTFSWSCSGARRRGLASPLGLRRRPALGAKRVDQKTRPSPLRKERKEREKVRRASGGLARRPAAEEIILRYINKYDITR